MCDHGGTEVLNLSQNNLSLVPEFPFSLVISKMREVYQITSHQRRKASPFESSLLFTVIRALLLIQVNLTNAHLRPGQARSLMTQVADVSSLYILKISENDLSSVPGTP